jgi:RNA binding exosome subunit
LNTTGISIHITTHCHATEDCGKVINALRNILPEELRDKVTFSREDYTGHYGNRITVLSTVLKDNDALLFIKHLRENMSDIDKSILKASLSLRYDAKKRRLYLRLDKQAALNRRLMLTDGDDVIRIVVGLQTAKIDIEKLLEK